MTPVRPTNLPQAPAQNARVDGPASAGQRAFFEAALGKTYAPAAQPRTAPPAVYAQPVQRIPDPNAEPPQKILRPGSLLDIRV